MRVIVSDAATGERVRLTFSARWRAAGDRKVTGELRKPTEPESSAAVGRVGTRWRNFSDRFGPFSGATRLVRGLQGVPDPATELAEIEMEIDGVVLGRPVRVKATRIDGRPNIWDVRGKPADWWASVTLYRDGVPIPMDFDRD